MSQQPLLHHFLAALGYRARKALSSPPEGFADFSAGRGTRTPKAILRHVGDVLARTRHELVGGTALHKPGPQVWEEDVERFYAVLRALDAAFRETPEVMSTLASRLLQGPLADAMTHVGQLATLRRLAGSPVPREDYLEASVGRGDLEWPERSGPRGHLRR